MLNLISYAVLSSPFKDPRDLQAPSALNSPVVAIDPQERGGEIDVLRPEPSPAFWSVRPNGGSVRWEGSALVLRPSPDGRAYPLLLTRPGVLRGNWTLTVRFRFLQVGDRGEGIALRNAATGREALRAHADRAQRGIQLWAGDAARTVSGAWSGEPSVALGGDPSAEHAYSVTKAGGLLAFRYDGRELARAQAEPGEYALRIGSDVMTYPGAWSTITLSSLTLQFLGDPPKLI